MSSAALAAQLPNFDAVADAPRIAAASPSRIKMALAATPASRLQWDDRFDVPTFVWPAPRADQGVVAAARIDQSPEAAARQYLAEYAPLYGLTDNDVADAYVAQVHDTGRGAVIVKLRQKINGVPVFRDELNVVMTPDRDLVALSGHISALPRASRIAAMSTQASPFLLTAASAISAAATDAQQPLDINQLRIIGTDEAGYQLYDNGSSAPIRARRVYFHLPSQFEPAYYMEMYVGGDENTSPELYSYVMSAVDGRLLLRNNMTCDAAPAAFTYRVWAQSDGDHLPFSGPQGYDATPHPTASPSGYQPTFIAPNLVTLAYGAISTKDPWLADSAFETIGNNVDAYADLFAPDGFSGGDLRANVNAALTFDRAYDLRQEPGASPQQQMASITQLFYVNNFLHDWFYDSGFNEAAGNAQDNNFGRGGLGGDSIHAEAQDYGGRNNANMSTPSDGGHPRMQMYVWDTAVGRDLRVDMPSTVAKSYVTGYAFFGAQSYNVAGDVVGVTPVDGCSAITSDVSGKIAFINRGGTAPAGALCTFALKAQNAKTAGAIGVIIGNVSTSTTPDSVINMACATTACSPAELALPPTMLVALNDANGFRNNLTNGIHATMRRDAAVSRDGTIDNQIVAHEWMHYVSNRLIGDGNGLINVQARGMGEGWSDFNALLLTTRAEDTKFESNATFGGAYAAAIYVTTGGGNGPLLNNGAYYGVRRVPYSTDMTKDPLTFKHVTNGVAITGATLKAGADGANNAEVHNTGEVWGTMLWEAYASLLRDTLGPAPRLTFAQAQQRMKDYLIASLKITPPTPTMLEARDALLAVVFARDKVDYAEFWQAFAKRGAGMSAQPAERYSTSNSGVAEDFNGSGGMTLVRATIDDSVSSCLKNGVLDAGESGVLRLSLRNTGGVRLESTTIKVASSDASLTFANGGAIDVPATNPGDNVVVTLNASLANGAQGIINPDVTIAISDPQIATSGGMKTTYQPALNAFEAPKDSATDDMESATTAWSVGGTGAARWKRIEISARDHRWFAEEPFNAVDTYLMSPPLVVASSGNFTFTFRHRYGFDYAQGNSGPIYVDGGVIEISTDDGATWADIGDKIDRATQAYGLGSIFANNGSAIEGRRAFEATSPGFNPDFPSKSPFITTAVNLGADYAGKRVRIRFRSVTASDHSFAPRTGWEIDDVAFTNVTNLPFGKTTPDQGLCKVTPSTIALASSASNVPLGQPLTFSVTVTAASSPSGTVDFFDNGAIVGTSRVANGAAQLTATLPNGTHVMTAVFNGNKYFTPATSLAVTVQVGQPRHRSVHK